MSGRSVYEGAGTGTYPLGWDYLFFGLWRYLQYMGDPLMGKDSPFSKGLPYQVAAAGKKAVVILPMSSVATEVGVFLKGDAMLEAVRELQAYMFRREGVFEPALGRGALGSFSSGNLLVNQFLARNQNHVICKEILKEVYMFDGPGSTSDNGRCCPGASCLSAVHRPTSRRLRSRNASHRRRYEMPLQLDWMGGTRNGPRPSPLCC